MLERAPRFAFSFSSMLDACVWGARRGVVGRVGCREGAIAYDICRVDSHFDVYFCFRRGGGGQAWYIQHTLPVLNWLSVA